MSGIERFYSPPEIGAPGRRSAQRQRRILWITGTGVVAMLVMFGIAIVYFTGTLGKTRVFMTQCTTTGGIVPGTPVLQADFIIGKVKTIDWEQDPNSHQPLFTIVMNINNKWRVPRDSWVVIGSAGLLQGNVIKVMTGEKEQTSNSAASEGIRGNAKGRVSEMEKSILIDGPMDKKPRSLVCRQESDLIGYGKSKIDNLDSQLNTVLSELRNLIITAHDKVDAFDEEKIKEILASVDTSAGGIEQITDSLNSITTRLQKRRDIEEMAKSYRELAKTLNIAVEKYNPEIESALSDTRFSMQQLAKGLTPILQNLEETTRNLKELSLDLRSDPSLILRGRKRDDIAPNGQP